MVTIQVCDICLAEYDPRQTTHQRKVDCVPHLKDMVSRLEKDVKALLAHFSNEEEIKSEIEALGGFIEDIAKRVKALEVGLKGRK